MSIKAYEGQVVILRKMCDLCSLEMERNKNAEKKGEWGEVRVYEFRCKNGHVDTDTRNPSWEVRPVQRKKETPK